jgi:hypothetical protein
MSWLPRIRSVPVVVGCVVAAWLVFDVREAEAAPGRTPPNYRPSMPPRPPPPAPIPPRPFDFDSGFKNAGSRFFGLAGATAGQTSGTAGLSGQGGVGGLGGGGLSGLGGGGLGGLGGGGLGGLGGGGLGGFNRSIDGGAFGGKQFGMDGGSLHHQEPYFRHGIGVFGEPNKR